MIPSLTADDRKRLLVLSQLTDLVVPLECMGVEGAQAHRSKTFGHTGGFVAHLLADRDIILRFAGAQLTLDKPTPA